jgi:large subunit ribosomal protein L24e
MVVKRQCSFCAAEIEPGTGMMFVKRDGSIFHFCTSSCRKQQLHLGRVGHRLKWTRAHALKKAADRSAAAARPTGAKPARGSKRPPTLPAPAPAPAVAPEPKAAPAAPAEPVAAAPPAAEEPKPKAPPKPRPRAKKPAAEKAKDTP